MSEEVKKRKEPKASGKRTGRPPWTEEQRQSYRETIARRRREAEARGEKVPENAAAFHHPQLAKKPEDLAIVRSLMAETLHSWHGRWLPYGAYIVSFPDNGWR